MNWEQYRLVMEKYAIKTDDMATEDAYFMATHMPFSQLEVYQGGRTSAPPNIWSEDRVFEELVCNPNDEHRLVIVRGDNGTGKSHLIRYLKAKFESSPATVYNRDREQLVFLRRLNNSVRGVFSQLLDQNVICDPAVAAKLRKFIASSDAKDEEAFKTDILFAYVAAVSNDQSGKNYKPVICQTIASFLSDSRIKERLLAEGGPISRCYQVITSPSDQVLKDSTIFTVADFDDKKVIKSVYRKGDPKASDYANTLLHDSDEITLLVNYLNRFTREVVQRCADVSSESTKAMFEQLRRDLKKQNKNLTLFIEDFTGFTGIDSELITVLSTEHGGDYADLCRVTALVGITNAYYDQFRDNFTDRVTHQISVTDRSYGTDEFLVQLTGRYLNAIYTDPKVLREWYKPGQELTEVPVSNFKAPCRWETTTIDGREVTLYPFNRKAIRGLYDQLKAKSPRSYLKSVIKSQMKEFLDGKLYGDEWAFPLNPGNTQMTKDQHSSAIDRIEAISNQDRVRLKTVLALWADGSATGRKELDGTISFGGVPQEFFKDIGLSAFSGIGDIQDASTGTATGTEIPVHDNGTGTKPKDKQPPEVKPRIDPKTKKHQTYKDDISEWFSAEKELKYHADYRKWLQEFIFGNNNQPGAINWQDIGVPAYVACERASHMSCIFIEGQDTGEAPENVLVSLARSADGRDVLYALAEMQYAGGWDFESAPYYQQRLITWLEREKTGIIQRVTAVEDIQKQLPALEWCVANQYLRAMICGISIPMDDPIKTMSALMKSFDAKKAAKRVSKDWEELISFVQYHESEFESARKYMIHASASTMGAIRGSTTLGDNELYRVEEMLCVVEKLMDADWNIESGLPKDIPAKHMLYNHAALLKQLYPRIRKAVEAEQKMAEDKLDELKAYVGEMTTENLVVNMNAILNLFNTLSTNGIWSLQGQKQRYGKAPLELAKEIMAAVRSITDARNKRVTQVLALYSDNALASISDWVKSFSEIERVAALEARKAEAELQRIGVHSYSGELIAAAQAEMENLCEILENMEVRG